MPDKLALDSVASSLNEIVGYGGDLPVKSRMRVLKNISSQRIEGACARPPRRELGRRPFLLGKDSES